MPTEAVRRPARALPAWTAVGEAQWLPGALLLAGLGLLAATGVIGLRTVAGFCCCLPLLLPVPRRLLLACMVSAALSVLLWPLVREQLAVYSPIAGGALLAASFLVVIVLFEAACAVPGLALSQLSAAALTWLVSGRSYGLAGLLLAAAILHVWAAARRPASDDLRAFNGFLAGVTLVFAVGVSHRGGIPLTLSLLPLAPLVLDGALRALRAVFAGARSRPAPASGAEIIAGAAGHARAARRVFFFIGLGWYGPVVWWGTVAGISGLAAAVISSVPVVFSMLVLVWAGRRRSEVRRDASQRHASAHRLAGLDGLRAFAVTLVVASHVGLVESRWWQDSGAGRFLNAQVGVEVFFVLSGLLITRLLFAERQRTGRLDFPAFYLRRVLRIFPVYFAAIAFTMVLVAVGLYRMGGSALAFAMTYAMNFAPWKATDPTFSHFWSLAVEEHFYFVWPVLVGLASGRPRWAAAIAAAGIAAMAWWSVSPPQFVQALSQTHPVNRWTVPAALPILVGCLGAALSWGRQLSVTLLRLLGAAGLLAWVVGLAGMDGTGLGPVLHHVLACLGIAGVITYVALSPRAWLTRVLEWPPIAYLGGISYGVYVWQGILTGNGPYRPMPGWPPDPLIGAVAACVVAALSYHFLEKPILAYKDRLARS
jgi:peptidoglycan/LPS O-acetylase OafA/YrhL